MYLDNTSGGLEAVLSSGSHADTAQSTLHSPGTGPSSESKQLLGSTCKSQVAAQPVGSLMAAQPYDLTEGVDESCVQTAGQSGELAKPMGSGRHPPYQAAGRDVPVKHHEPGVMAGVHASSNVEPRGAERGELQTAQGAKQVGLGRLQVLQREDSPNSDVSATSVEPMMSCVHT